MAEPVTDRNVENSAPAGEEELAPPRRTRNPSEPARALRDLLAVRSGERHIVAIQDYPDPDAISSALAYQEIAAIFDISADISYEGLISHPENLALVNLLEIPTHRFSDGSTLQGYDAAVFVDNQGTTTRLAKRLRAAGVPTLAIIDHHDLQDALDPIFSDIRPVGAAATLFAEYLQSGAFFHLEGGNERHVRLATALLHGLHSETGNLIRAGASEYQAAAFLSDYADRDLLERVLCVQKSRGTMETIEAALGRRLIRGGLSLAGIGFIRWADRDAIPQAADFLLKEENVTTAVVYGVVVTREGRESIMGSLRTTNAAMGVDSFLKQALGSDPSGRPYGGGRSRAGGFEIDLGFLASGSIDQEERDLKWSLFDRQIRRKLFEAAGLGRESEG